MTVIDFPGRHKPAWTPPSQCHLGDTLEAAFTIHRMIFNCMRMGRLRGGDRLSHRIEAHAAFLKTMIEEPPDITLDELCQALLRERVRRAIERRGATLLFLPPYSPNFNPIEMAFAKIKALLRKAAARTQDALTAAVRDAINAIAPAEVANYFTAAGYEPD